MMLLSGLIAATFTPMDDHGAVNVSLIPTIVDGLLERGVNGFYVCGSTGEGPSLTTVERKAVAEAYVSATRGRVPVVVQVGHNSLEDARDLAAHAASIGADAISAVPPTYFKPNSLGCLIDTVAQVCDAAPDTPFYYYHIPVLSGVNFDMPEFLKAAPVRIPSLAGIKFSCRDLDIMQRCKQIDGGRFNILFGVDEMLLSGLAAGCDGAVGSTYNFLSPLFLQVIEQFEAGKLNEARATQARANDIIRILIDHGGIPGLKAAMTLSGLPCGPTRLPLRARSKEQIVEMRRALDAVGFFDIEG